MCVFAERSKFGTVLCARSINPFEGGRWRCGGCGLVAAPDLTAMGIESFFVCSLLILLGLRKPEENENRKSTFLRHDVRSIAREASVAPATTFKRAIVNFPSCADSELDLMFSCNLPTLLCGGQNEEATEHIAGLPFGSPILRPRTNFQTRFIEGAESSLRNSEAQCSDVSS